MEKIESASNKKYKYWLGLHQAKQLKKSEHFLVCGGSWTKELAIKHPALCDAILLEENMSKDLDPSFSKLKSFVFPKALFTDLDPFGTKSPILVLKKPALKDWEEESNQSSGLNLFLPTGDPSNLGAILRVASAFSVDRVILLKEACSLFHSKCVRAAAGNLLDLNIYLGPSINELNTKGLHYLDMSGKALGKTDLPKDLNLVLGEEGPGVPAEKRQSENCLSIPMNQGVESLNAATAAAISLFEYRRQHHSFKP